MFSPVFLGIPFSDEALGISHQSAEKSANLLSWQTLMALQPWRTEQPNAVALLLLHRGRHAIPPAVRPATMNVTAGKLELVTLEW